MGVKNVKEKGNNFERKVAKLLSEWSGVKFMRTPSSGAIHNFKDKRVVSDIVPPLSLGEFPFSIECKCVECSWEFSAIIENTSQNLRDHWSQAVDDANRENLRPMLIFSKNFRDIFIAIRKCDYDIMSLNITNCIFSYSEDRDTLVIFKMKDFFGGISCENLMGSFSVKNTDKGTVEKN